MNKLTHDQLKRYIYALFVALKHLHAHGVIHRDIKPSNFLYSISRDEFLLVDFGLAEIDLTRTKASEINPSETSYTCNSTTTPRAGRAGTRGFRAPEVLMKSTYQTTALDIWSAGVILLCILTTRYPFFHSPDDLTALAEVACLCGTSELQEAALKLYKSIHFPEERPKVDLSWLCEKLHNRGDGKGSEWLLKSGSEVYHFLERCLDPNPVTRMTAVEALEHPFLKDVFQSSK
eukprot:TRINITY_DN17878_c0_g1_i1.p1 TRINITY_DN17878_c0_g1~~TRINITY_DN17878_c0_g1_i1.p1  ORF type:complete len:264 (-),score=26.63 TRINITY_DN17878_c0_g1_i1:161-859(-)